MKFDMILVRYGEMTLKKDNYKSFLQKVVNSIKSKLSKFEKLKIEVQPYRLFINLNGEDELEVIKQLDKVCGLYSYSLCKRVNKNIDSIACTATELLKEYIKDNNLTNFTFKVDTARSDKNFPMTSIEISKKIASTVLPNFTGIKVDVHNPQVTLSIDLRFEAAYIYINEVKGLGGYPAGVGGKALSMMSGGLDSPVSSFLMMKKGVKLSAIHFFSYPYTSYSSLQKVYDLLEELSEYNYKDEIELHIVPFTKIQDAIHEKADNTYMVTLMRRAMYRIASIVCEKNHIDAIVNGESVGQVASQTLESINVVNEVTNIPIIRPLAAYDKEDIIKIARKIGTHDISIRPYEDCCTVFVPKHPVIKPRIDLVKHEENKCELDDLIIDAVNNIKTVVINKENHLNAFEDDSNKYEI